VRQHPGTATDPAPTTGYSTTFTVEQSPDVVYAAILDTPAWWTGQITGSTDSVGAEFTYDHPPQHHSVQLVLELVPSRRVVWRVIESDLAFPLDPGEWTGTEIVFEIAATAKGTELRFTHQGLLPEFECFGSCSSAWMHYINASLRSVISTGQAVPEPW
jgi:hypothetical protein